MTFVELLVAIMILAIGLLGLVGSLLYASRLIRESNEVTIAKNAARTIIESMRMYDTGYIYACYNSNSDDDPPGYHDEDHYLDNFPVPGLNLRPDDEDDYAGKIEFPEVVNPDPPPEMVLSETVTDPELGMPRDLNGDGDADDVNVSTGYRLLPVTVRVQWEAYRPEMEIRLQTFILVRYVPPSSP